MKKSCLFFCSVLVLAISFLSYQLIILFDVLKTVPLVNADQCTLVPGIMGPEDILNWHGIGIAGVDDRVKLWYGGDSIPLDSVPNGGIYGIYPSNTSEHKITYRPLKLHNFPDDIAFHPHGMALYPYSLFVINHAYAKGGERIEVFGLDCDSGEDKVKVTYNYSLTFKGELANNFGAFNDLIAISPNEILITSWVSIPHTIKGLHNSETSLLDLKRLAAMIGTEGTYVYYCKADEMHELECKKLEHTASAMNNGINFNRKDLVMVAKTVDKKVSLYRLVEKNGEKDLEFLRDIEVGYAVDNIDYDPETNTFYLGVVGKCIDFLLSEFEMMKHGRILLDSDFRSGVAAIRIEENVNDMRSEIVYMQNTLKGLSVGTKFKDYILLGGPFYDGVSVCSLQSN